MLKMTFTLLSGLLLLTGPTAWSAMSAADIARLGTDLTPLGGERAGNKDGTIPSWKGGITSPPTGYKPGDHHPDPFVGDPVSFTINAANMAQHADKLTAGHKAMLKAYDTFSMNVYPTHRSASNPQHIYDATKKYAATAKLVKGGNGVTGIVNGVPFPLPTNGQEVIWNHVLHFKGGTVTGVTNMAPVTSGGDYTLVKRKLQTFFRYEQEGMTEDKLDNVAFKIKQKIVAPAKLAGLITLVHETLDQAKEGRKAWQYFPGQRRVRRAPTIAFDTPQDGSDGLATFDVINMFNGSLERYDWQLIGKKEFYVPYNAYKLHSDTLKYKDILKSHHLNPEHLRYELHRVWVVDATLKPGARHIYKRRTFYVDEDSWAIVAMEQYDNKDTLWRVSEGHPINTYERPAINYTVEAHYDLKSGRYLADGLDNEGETFKSGVKMRDRDFTSAALRLEGTR